MNTGYLSINGGACFVFFPRKYKDNADLLGALRKWVKEQIDINRVEGLKWIVVRMKWVAYNKDCAILEMPVDLLTDPASSDEYTRAGYTPDEAYFELVRLACSIILRTILACEPNFYGTIDTKPVPPFEEPSMPSWYGDLCKTLNLEP